MIAHDLAHPDYDPLDCPEWAKETLLDSVLPFRGRNGMPAAHRDREGPLAMTVRGVDRYQANQFIVFRAETADYLYARYTFLDVDYRPGLLPAYEKLAADATGGCRTATERAVALLSKGASRLRHPSIPPCGVRVSPDRNLDDEDLLESRLGWCNEQARVFIRLCQVSGIPARMIHLFYADSKSGHTVAEFYADGRWCMADASWFCVFPGTDGKLLSAAQCHDGGEGQKRCGQAYFERQQEALALSDADLNLGICCDPIEWRRRVATETAGDLADKMGCFAVINYPLPPARKQK